MTMTSAELIADLRSRGLIAQITREDVFEAYLAEESRTLYCGFDPTADSLHIGSLVPLLTLKRFQLAGHKPLALIGGATGLIGDPSFKAQERKLNTPEIVGHWVDKLKVQVAQFISFDCGETSASVVNNLDWIKELNILDFLRDVGKHFSVSNMIAKESVKQRIDRDGDGISFTEFTYMLLQSYDFSELYARHNCTLQIGGSDQWGNITGGVELSRRQHGAQVFGLTLPLVTKSDGSKFGKTEAGTVWLDPQKTSPYAFYQFWMNSADADAYKFLRYFTFLDVAEIEAIEEADNAASGRPQAQKILAEEVTRLVHGESNLQAAQRITEALFSGGLDQLSVSDMEQLQQDGLPCTSLSEIDLTKEMLTGLLVASGLAKNGKQVKDALSRNAILVNGVPVTSEENLSVEAVFALPNARYGRFFVVKLGKKNYHLFVL
jgi:tyrosyl-tRNA synthetase